VTGPGTAGLVGRVSKCSFPAVTLALANGILASRAGPARPRLVFHLLHHSSAPASMAALCCCGPGSIQPPPQRVLPERYRPAPAGRGTWRRPRAPGIPAQPA
jgi:hypothetical protein